MKVTKRTALGMLGLAATPVAGESFGKPLAHGVRFGIERREHFAAALRALADDIEKGGTYPQHVELKSSADIEDFLMHTLTIKFAMVDR